MSEEERKQGQAPAIITREGHSVGKTEEFKRSSHTDFCTSPELAAQQFSGIRHNSISNMMEIWVEGGVVASMDTERAHMFPQEWERLYADAFGLHHVERDA